MARDLYRAIHKAMRKDLFEVSALIAATDFEEAADIAALRDRFAGLVSSLEHHAQMEDEGMHPLAGEVAPEVVADIEAEHAVLDPELAMLREELADLAAGAGAWEPAHAFYLRFNRFVASYLNHIDREERELMPRLAEVDEKRLDALAAKDYEGPVRMLVGAMTAMMPLFNTDDQRRILADIEAVRNPEEFALVAVAAERALGSARWAKLHT